MLNVNVINAKNTQKVEVKPGQPANLKVDPNTRFELVDPVSGKAPTQIKARRVGDNLEIVTDEKAQIEDEAFSNAQKPDLVLENYYKQADVSLFAGAGEEAVSYVPVDGAASSSYAAMNTSATTGAALGVLPLLNPLLGAAVVGAGAVVATNSNDSGISNQPPVAQDAATKVSENKVISDKVPTATDADGTVASYRLASDVAAGKLTFNADGSYSFEANKDFDSLAEGQTKTVSFTYSAVDNAGGVSEPKTVTITVTGVNDAPVASAASKSVDEGMKVEGSVSATDADAGATLKYRLVGTAPAGLSFKDDGTYSFDAGNAGYDSLKAGESKDVVVKFKANDGTVDSAEQTLTITVKGAAEIEGDSAGAVIEDASTATATGTLTVSGADAGQTKVVAQTDKVGIYGKFSITEAGEWTYTLDNGKANVQALNANEKATETFTVKSADGTASQDVVETITGVNDAAMITGTSKGSVTEDAATSTATGTLSVSDADAGQDKVVAQTDSAGTFGKFSIKDTGEWTYTLDNSKANVLALVAGEKVKETFTVKSADGTASQDVEVTITGVNNAAMITGTRNGSVTEDAATTTATGTLSVSDADAGQSKAVAQTDSAGTFGKFSIKDTGEWTYTLDNSKAAVQALGAGEKVEETVTVKSADGTASQDVVVMITGVNDTAAIEGTSTGAVTENAATATATGTLNVTDADAGQTKVVAQTGTKGTYGSFTITESGSWTYTLDNGNANVQALNVNQEVKETFTVKSADDTDSQDVVVTITGANDAPEIRLVGNDSKNLEFQETNDVLIAKRTMSVTDQDLEDGFTAQVLDFTFDGTTAFDVSKYTPQQLQDIKALIKSIYGFGVLSVEKVNADHNLTWGFTSRQPTNADWLGEGETLVLNYTIQVKDKSGAEASQIVTVKINGTNDAPVAREFEDAVNEGDLLNDRVIAVDPEDNPLTYSLVGAAPAGLSFKDDGTFSFDAAYDSLLEDEPKDVTFKFMATDGKLSSNEGSSTITIRGKNDVAKIDGTSTGSVSEDAAADTVKGALQISDADAGQSKAIAQSDVTGIYGKFSITESGEWTYTLDNSSANVQVLKDNQEVKETFKVNSADGTATQDVVVTIKGANDAAVFTGDSTGLLTEDGSTIKATGQLSVSDVDIDQSKVIAQTDVASKYGKFSITEDGEWTYVLDNQAIQSLPGGYFLKDKITVYSNDGLTTQDIAVEIDGADDQATITFVKDTKGEDLSVVKHDEAVDSAAPTSSGTMTVGVMDDNDKILISGVKFNAAESTSLLNTGLTAGDFEERFIDALYLHTIVDNGGVHNLKWDFYTDGLLPKDFHLVLDYTLQSLNGEVGMDDQVKDLLIEEKNLRVDVTGVNSPVTISLTGKDADALIATETNGILESSFNTLTVDELDGDRVRVEVGFAKVNLDKSDFLKASNVTSGYEGYIKKWLSLGENINLNLNSNLEWKFKTLYADDLDFVPEGKTLVLDYVLNVYENDVPVTSKTIEVVIKGKNDSPTYVSLTDSKGEDSSFANLNISTNHFAKAQGTLTPYDPDFVETITHEIKGVSFDAVHSTPGMKSKFDALNLSLKSLLTYDVLPNFSDPHSFTWKFNASEVDLSQSLADVQAGSVLAMDYVLRVSDVLGAFSEQKIHIELNV